MISNLLLIKLLHTSYLNIIIKKFIRRVYLRFLDVDIWCSCRNLLICLYLLKMHTLFQFSALLDIIVYDIPGKINRFSFVYVLGSIKFNTYLNIRLQTNGINLLNSVITIFRNAVWLEREIWDLFGIFFSGNNDLRRILTDYGFIGHPLRKDFPLNGFIESYYSEFYRRIIYKKLEFILNYRYFYLVK